MNRKQRRAAGIRTQLTGFSLRCQWSETPEGRVIDEFRHQEHKRYVHPEESAPETSPAPARRTRKRRR